MSSTRPATGTKWEYRVEFPGMPSQLMRLIRHASDDGWEPHLITGGIGIGGYAVILRRLDE